MSLKKILLLAAVVLICVLSYLFFTGDSDKNRILKQLRLLSEYVGKSPDEKALKTLYKAQQLPGLFAPECDLELEGTHLTGTFSPEELASHVARARTNTSKLSLTFADINIVEINENSAKLVFTATLKGKSNSGKDELSETREIEATMKKHDGKFLFSGFKCVKVLEH